MAKEVPFTDIFSKLVENFERVIKVIDGVQYLTTILAVLIVLSLASVVGYMFWKGRRKAMGRLFFVCLGLLCAFGLLGVLMPQQRQSDFFIVGTMTGLHEPDPETGVDTIRHRITATIEPPFDLFVFNTNNAISPRFQWVVRVNRQMTCRTFVHVRIYEGKNLLHTLYVPLFAGGAPAGNRSVHVNVQLRAKRATAEIDGTTHKVEFEPPDPERDCTHARAEPPAAQPRRTGFLPALVRSAFAQTATPQEEKAFRIGLASPDPTVRSQSRTELARRGKGALPWIQAVIRDENSPPALAAGVIGALIDMQAQRAQLHKATVARLIDLLDDKEAELRRTSRELLRRIADAEIVADLAKHFEAAKGEAAQGARAGRLAYAVLDINYAYGIKRYFEFDKDEKNLAAMRAAVKAFQAIVAAADAVAAEDRAPFARGHWGQIVVKHHRYWTLPAQAAEAKALRAELMAHFKALLAVENAKDEAGRPAYRYRHHIETARKCTTGDYAKSCVTGG